ncbi:MAG: putative carboxypeptidase YodJ [Chroococcidiopsis sp. SAG 2025]|nr:putative carboxypeptidase YodJ [Chroococcidiopsis sp. SAG 2025]
MKLDSKRSGIELVLISGFRSITAQNKLFLKQINRKGNKELAAKLSAPPGYSEHHTGYGLDIGEGKDIDTYTKFEFDRTQAYFWLTKNAHKYGFELSFPKNNLQGVSYEPWHWRYINSPIASKVFENARNLKKLS